MDQLKEILRQAIKYRFWISVGLAALLPMIAYFVGSGPVKAKTTTEEGVITTTHKAVLPFKSGKPINAQYKPVVEEKTEVLNKDVDASWKKLYARQSPLLTWPERVQDRFTKWGRVWPANVDPSAISIAIIDYVNAYPNFVTEVYKTCNPFDPAEGTGVVSVPPESTLLRPATFTIENPPALGKVWAAQERLWIQRTLLDVVAKVNNAAKDWDGAIIKQINTLEVGTPIAQDQRSIAKGETVEVAPSIDDPSKPKEETAEGAAPGAAGGNMAEMYASGGGQAGSSPMSYYGGRRGGGALGGAAGATEEVYYFKTDSTQFKIMPVMMSVLIDQTRVQDFLVALENSPMTIQVMDFEMAKPSAKVVKPEKGNAQMNFGMYGGMSQMYGGMPGMPGGFGGNYMRGMRGMMGEGGMGMYGGMGGGYPGMGMGMGMGGGVEKKGVDKRSENLAQKFKEQVKSAKSAAKNSIQDPYFNIVEVTIYGQARFFNPPTAEAPTEPSQAAAAGEGEKKDEAPKAEAEKKEEAPKPEAEKKDEAPKAEAEKKEEAPKPEAEKKGEAPKPEAEKKGEAPKAEAPKAEAPKGA
jgi:hypothetical protein